ncbi:protein-tyrosine phosphatase-like protein [Naematelia encephala]|uniref:Protein-tyrosine phosphatase-like protein n=1 Tax=Naematelia encephala TaxID=71784 RepID=A0A1Y2B933_9TREE|nr:protein-tyrosine phosphatase-like protein [Naematelia encephala]
MPSLNETYYILQDREDERREFSSTRSHSHYPRPESLWYSVSNSTRNANRNRYSNVLAYDRTAVTVDLGGGDGKRAYLNANVVCDGRGDWWVASQAPLPNTLHAFFLAILTRSASQHPLVAPLIPPSASSSIPCTAILVQLTGFEENGLSKADPYLPYSIPGEPRTYSSSDSPLTLDLHPLIREPMKDHSSIRTEVDLSSSAGDVMRVIHYHFEGWPDFGVPKGDDVKALERLVREVVGVRAANGGLACEVWVHCSAGVGRTGTFLSLLSLLPRPFKPISDPHPSPLGPIPDELAKDPVAQTIDQIREYRGMMVQGPEQMRFIYEVSADMCISPLRQT